MREHLKLTITILLLYFHYTNSFYRKQAFIEMDLISQPCEAIKTVFYGDLLYFNKLNYDYLILFLFIEIFNYIFIAFYEYSYVCIVKY